MAETKSNYDQFLDNEKKRGRIVWTCLQCSFRGIGSAVNYHEIANPTHELVNEAHLDRILIDKIVKP